MHKNVGPSLSIAQTSLHYNVNVTSALYRGISSQTFHTMICRVKTA